MGEVGERKILVAVDESEESSYALSWSLHDIVSPSSQNMPTHLALFTLPLMSQSMERYNNQVAGCVLDKARRICSSVLINNNEIKVETMAEDGDPRDVISQVAARFNVDVMGSHGYGLIQRAFLGSVSNHCAQNLKCPVLIVKKPKSNGGN